MKWKCLLCGRDRFDQPGPHRCVGGFRKRFKRAAKALGVANVFVPLENLTNLTPLESFLKNAYTDHKPCVVGGQDKLGYTVWLKVGVQSFEIGSYRETKEEAHWMREMLAKALANVVLNADHEFLQQDLKSDSQSTK